MSRRVEIPWVLYSCQNQHLTLAQDNRYSRSYWREKQHFWHRKSLGGRSRPSGKLPQLIRSPNPYALSTSTSCCHRQPNRWGRASHEGSFNFTVTVCVCSQGQHSVNKDGELHYLDTKEYSSSRGVPSPALVTHSPVLPSGLSRIIRHYVLFPILGCCKAAHGHLGSLHLPFCTDEQRVAPRQQQAKKHLPRKISQPAGGILAE